MPAIATKATSASAVSERSTTQSGPADSYVYEIRVNGVVRYIGKGRGGRMDFHLIEANRAAGRPRSRHRNLSPHFRKMLVEAVRGGCAVRARKLKAHLTSRDAYAHEEALIGRYHLHSAGQLWNTLDERFMKPEYLPDEWANPVCPMYRLPRPLRPGTST